MRFTNRPHAPSCSISCYKEHKPIHAVSAAPPTTKPTELAQPAPTTPANQPQPKTQPSKDLQTTSQALINSPLYKTLLSRYPNLLSDLLKIYKATLEPAEVDSKRRKIRDSGRGRGRGGDRSRGSDALGRERQWDLEKGRKKALRMLQRMAKQNEGVKEFGEVVKVMRKTEEPECQSG